MNGLRVDASGTYVADLVIEDFERALRNLIGQLICCKHKAPEPATTSRSPGTGRQRLPVKGQ